jgi:hypothetical protein
VDGLVRVVHANVHVDPEDDLLACHELKAGDQVPVARARNDALVLPEGERMRAGRPDGQAVLLRHLVHRAPERAQLVPGLDGVLHGRRGDLADALHQLRLHLAVRGHLAEVVQEPLDGVREVERLLVDDHELLLDPKGVGGAREPVLHKPGRV